MWLYLHFFLVDSLSYKNLDRKKDILLELNKIADTVYKLKQENSMKEEMASLKNDILNSVANDRSIAALPAENNAAPHVAIDGLFLDNLSPLRSVLKKGLLNPMMYGIKKKHDLIKSQKMKSIMIWLVMEFLSHLAIYPSIDCPFVESHMQGHAEEKEDALQQEKSEEKRLQFDLCYVLMESKDEEGFLHEKIKQQHKNPALFGHI
ncbi:hypothetical protein BD560DRAFT_426010 [Blakeslea trispora]|nr:hypothetical protein BD560DRAFT_426010 [Blakeslea trispora]